VWFTRGRSDRFTLVLGNGDPQGAVKVFV
jgi:hypothetical protein